MSYRTPAEAIEALAAEIGETLYIDVAKWHLYLANAHLHTPLAEQLYPLVTTQTCTSAAVTRILQEISVPLGGGQRTLPLLELLPRQAVTALLDLLEEYQRTL